MRTVGTGAIHLYRYTLAPLLATLAGGVTEAGRCKYHPSCSRYALDAIARYGLARGVVLACWRLARCNPWSRGGVDRAEDQTIFRHPA